MSNLELTQIINKELTNPNSPEWNEGMRVIYAEMKKIASVVFSRSAHMNLSSSPTIFVHETFERLYLKNKGKWKNISHFYATASNVMRYIMIDYIRAVKTKKRSGVKIEFDETKIDFFDNVEKISDALNQLEDEKKELSDVILLKFFGGFNGEEIAKIRGVSRRTIQRQLKEAKNVLEELLTE